MDEKSNEITAISQVFDVIEIKGQVVTIDAIGTQTAIVEKIKERRANYVLALKRNREYYQTEEIKWLSGKKNWKGLKSIGMEEKTIQREKKKNRERIDFISVV